MISPPSSSARARLSELERVYNPVLGAFLVWRTAQGYFSEASHGLPIPLAYLTLPIALHNQSRDVLIRTNQGSGLSLFAAKLGAKQEDLLAIHERALALRNLSHASIAATAMANMLYLDPVAAKLLPLDIKPPTPSPDILKLGKACEKLGVWLARIPIEQVASSLRIAF
ncbi:three component ABC system middle component [Lysobacter gummosus]|uniref:three component ABC system middle component n=1 Tax=Lysobacter gummosus TaxID=262324 RepID=UPI0036320A9B